jgi:hypothetical protein
VPSSNVRDQELTLRQGRTLLTAETLQALPAKEFGKYVLLVNFSSYVERFARWHKVEVRGLDRPMPNATAGQERDAGSRLKDGPEVS